MPAVPTLIIPVETQVREMDAKLLLACCAAERGYPVVIGSRAYVHFAIADVSRGIYIAKSMRGMSGLMFRLIRGLGHDIIAWEEEALVHPQAEVFYTLRLSAGTIPFVSHLFAWGEENRQLLAGYPHRPAGLPIHLTGNPRGDMLRTELREFFDQDVRALKQEHGEFLLINTNFSDVNPYIPAIGLFLPQKAAGDAPRLGQAGKGMPLPFATGLRAHKQALLEDFLQMIPALERAMPDMNLVVRPHPSEDHGVYHELARRCSRVKVIHRGNVLPWLLASRALVHNGCTTAVEAYAMGVPAVAYLKTFDAKFDLDFQGFPNQLSAQCFGFDELATALRAIMRGDGPALATPERDALLDFHVAARTGPLAAERILDVLDATCRRARPAASALPARLGAAALVRVKAALTRLNMQRPGRNRGNYHDHRFPRLAASDVAQRVERLGRALGRFGSIRIRERGEHLFEVLAGQGAAP
jgi:surface carbohydrate biosynthesis protein